MKRTGWIPASKNPVRPGWYEWRCTGGAWWRPVVGPVRANWTGSDWAQPRVAFDRPRADCPGCQWRGLTKPAERQGIAERVKR